MATPKKFGSFAGVFTPSILTILGVIMYMRFGWVVGNAGLWGTLIIVFIAHIISFTTGLSISSIATDKKIGAGGVYYVLSRSLGLPIGGAIGLTLFVGTAFSIALYLVGFSESFNSYLGFDVSLNGYRITAGIALLLLTIMAFISTSIVLKTQFFILVAILMSLVSIFFGHSDFVPDTISSFGGGESVPMETVFAIFFPAVTGFTAGIAMSGDLKDPKRAIPVGTMSAIVVGLLVYIGLAVFIAYMIDPDILRKDNNILLKIAWLSPLVVAGIWGATLSSAIGGILGAPRILQAMSLDRITPKIFGLGQGKNNEPRLALILTVVIAFAGILIGELNLIARLVSMFYLAAYGFINLSFFLESWASADFKPTFKVSKWIGFIGFVTTFIIMFKLDMLAMFISFLVIGGVYLWLSKKQISLGEGDIWQSVWTNIVKKGLRRLDENEDHKRNWKPNILLFSGKKNARRHLLEFSRFLAGKMGIITNFDLIENLESDDLFLKTGLSYKDEILEEFGVFGRRLEVSNVYDGISMICSVFGFSGIEPNTVLMGWARNSKHPRSFSKMTHKLIDLDYNVLYLDYDKEMGFGDHKTIDLWWRGISSNAELSLMLVKLLKATQEWGDSKTRIILVNNTGSDQKLVKRRIEKLSESFRVKAEVFIINNFTNNKSIYDLMKIHSGKTDLIILGIPEITKNNEDIFVEQVNNLVDVLGTTLLIKASSKFEVTDFGLSTHEVAEKVNVENLFIPKLFESIVPEIHEYIESLDQKLGLISSEIGIFKSNQNRAKLFVTQLDSEIDKLVNDISTMEEEDVINRVMGFYSIVENISKDILDKDIDALKDILKNELSKYLELRDEIFSNQKTAFLVNIDVEKLEILDSDSYKLRKLKKRLKSSNKLHDSIAIKLNVKQISEYYNDLMFSKEFYAYLLNMLSLQSAFIIALPESIHTVFLQFLQEINIEGVEFGKLINEFAVKINEVLSDFDKLISDFRIKPLKQLKYLDRTIVNNVGKELKNVLEASLFDKKLSKSERREIRDYNGKVYGYAELWLKVHSYSFAQQISELSLKSLYFGIIKDSLNTLNRLNTHVFDKLTKAYMSLQVIIKKLELSKSQLSEFVVNQDELLFEPPTVEVGQKVHDLHLHLSDYLKLISEEIILMSPHSFEELNKNQIGEIDLIEIPLQRIVKHLLSSDFLHPVEKNLLRLDEQTESMNLRVKNIINLVNYFSGVGDNENKAELKILFDNIKNEYSEAKGEFEYKLVEFKELYYQTVNQLNMVMSMSHIVNNLSELNLNIRNEKKSKGFSIIADLKNKVNANIKKAYDFIENKNEDLKRLEYERKLNVFVPSHIKIRKIVNTLSLKKEVKDFLPYYYYQLFTSKHLLLKTGFEGREKALSELNFAFDNIDGSSKAVVLIAGESGVGKTYFIESVLANARKEKSINIKINDFTVKKPLDNALRRLTGKTGSVDFLFNSFPKNAIIVVEDVERLLNVYEKDKKLLNVLSYIIDKYSTKYHFILSANIKSLKVIDSMSSLMSSIVSTITLRPLSEFSIKNMIIDMHFADNLQLFNPKDEILKEKELFRAVKNIHNLSEGNPRIALQLWLASMSKREIGITLDLNFSVPNVKIEDELWLSLLSRMLVFGHVMERDLGMLFGKDADIVMNNITGMIKAGLVDFNSKENYKIKDNLKPFVEKWLNEKS